MIVGRIMKSDWEEQLEFRTIDELFALRALMQDVLSERIEAKKVQLERRLHALNCRRMSRANQVTPSST